MSNGCPDRGMKGLLRPAAVIVLCGCLTAATPRPNTVDQTEPRAAVDEKTAYVLGQDDEISIWAFRAEEFSEKVFRIDGDGYISVPMLGRIRAGGLTVVALEAQLTTALRKFIIDPQVSV